MIKVNQFQERSGKMAAQESDRHSSSGRHFGPERQPRHGVSQLLTVCLMVTLLCCLAAVGSKKTVLDQSFTTTQMVTTKNVAAVHKGLAASLNSFVTEGDSQFDFTGDLLTKQQVMADLNAVLANVYTGSQPLTSKKIVDQVVANFVTEATQKGVPLQSEQWLSYKSNFVAQVQISLNNQMNSSGLQQARQWLKAGQKFMPAFLTVNLILSAALAVGLLVQTRSLFRFSHYCGIAAFCAGLLGWLAVQLFKLSGVVENIAVASRMYQTIVTSYGQAVLKVFDQTAATMIYAGLGLLALALVGRILRQRK